jgi:hypothetical protein
VTRDDSSPAVLSLAFVSSEDAEQARAEVAEAVEKAVGLQCPD